MTIAPVDDSRPWPSPFPTNTKTVTLAWPPATPGLDAVDHMTVVEGNGPAAVRRPAANGWTEVEYLCYAAMFAHVALVKEYRRRLAAVTPTTTPTPAAEPARLVPLRTTARDAARLQRQAGQVEMW